MRDPDVCPALGRRCTWDGRRQLDCCSFSFGAEPSRAGDRKEFVADGRDEDGVRDLLGADGLIYQSVEDMLQAGRSMNPQIERFDASCFDGDYVSGDIDEQYLADLEAGGRGKGRVGAAR